ncbi:MAG: hypothetical protein H7A06_03415 [Pseudomonadales bacterium]|nr:hypothetical protein [Pseudomonadales bacterium]
MTYVRKIALCLPCLLVGNDSLADTPLGWISTENPSAYTIDALDAELSLGKVMVNDTIDFLNIRSDLLAGTRKLVGNSGDLQGQRAEVQFGLTSSLSVFYRHQEQDLKIELGEIASIGLTDISNGLSTTATAYGFKWNFFESGYYDNSGPWHAAALEVMRTRNVTDDYEGHFDRVTINENFIVTFTDPQTFRLDSMEDEGWQARLLYSAPLSSTMATTVWAGYGETSASSGTSADIVLEQLVDDFYQHFDMEDRHYMLGASVHWQLTPRIPVQLSYEFLRVNNSKTDIVAPPSNSVLPSFLRGDNLGTVSEHSNHTLRGSVSYWVTPDVHVSFTGKLFSNQFLGVIPHYNNPLSGSFADKPYGYVGLQLGLRL